MPIKLKINSPFAGSEATFVLTVLGAAVVKVVDEAELLNNKTKNVIIKIRISDKN
jgi:hypothetical protein